MACQQSQSCRLVWGSLSTIRLAAALVRVRTFLYVFPLYFFFFVKAHRAWQTVPYSLHSSFQEMSEFVRLLRPCEIFPVVPDKHADLHTHFRHFLNPVPRFSYL